MQAARLYIDPRCFLCKLVEPRVKAWFERQGLDLDIFKLHGREALQVNGPGVETVRDVPGVPALRVGRVVVVGFGILGFLRDVLKGRQNNG